MNGAHDMGGVHGFGPVRPEADEPVFHAEWERRVFALTLAMGATGAWNLDASRFAREARPPAEYLTSSYYEIWLAGLEALLAARGLASAEEVAAGRALEPAAPVRRTLAAADVVPAMQRGGTTLREPAGEARFAIGDHVRARNINPETHTRLPRYTRGRAGLVTAVHGAHVFPDSHARGDGPDPQWLYTVTFAARELWGPDADPGVRVAIDAFEPYLEAAG